MHALPLGLLPVLCSDVVSEPPVSAELKEWFQCSTVVFLSLVPLQLTVGSEFHIQKLCLQILGLGWLGNECRGTCGSEAAVWLPVPAISGSGAGGVKNVPTGQACHCFTWPLFLHSQAARLQSGFLQLHAKIPGAVFDLRASI